HLFNNEFALSIRWDYNRRREATEILPYLFLGPMTAARDRESLRRDGITMLLGIAHRSDNRTSTMVTGPLKAAAELGLDTKVIEVADTRELIATFPYAVQAINEHLVKVHEQSVQAPSSTIVTDYGRRVTGRVLVYCESGNERSAAVVAAYLIHMLEGTDHIKACQMCSMRRFSCNLDDNLKQCLLSYHEIVKAQRDVAAAPPTVRPGEYLGATMTLTARHKRSFDVSMEQEDASMGDVDDVERFAGRAFTPFQDQEGPGR
ncbi:MAG: dual specificity protein phosphatase family protein, partial [Terriglobus roseus]|nr:dual specificity protein phosphatase family protein [Terriglobus roseus]